MGEHLETVRAALESGDMDTVRDELDSFDFNAADTAIREALTVLERSRANGNLTKPAGAAYDAALKGQTP
jgi:hypothetical protein